MNCICLLKVLPVHGATRDLSLCVFSEDIHTSGWVVRKVGNKDDQEQTYQEQTYQLQDGSLEFVLSWFSLETGFYEGAQARLKLSALLASTFQMLGLWVTSPCSDGKMELPMRLKVGGNEVKVSRTAGQS